LLIRFAFQLKVSWLGNFALTYLVALIPFFVVNGLLTGIASDEPVVWYNEAHFTGVRLTTIPLEDLYYNLCMLLPIIAIHEWLLAKKKIA
jgi:lycopene cyclase domain-containing protein